MSDDWLVGWHYRTLADWYVVGEPTVTDHGPPTLQLRTCRPHIRTRPKNRPALDIERVSRQRRTRVAGRVVVVVGHAGLDDVRPRTGGCRSHLTRELDQPGRHQARKLEWRGCLCE